MSVSYTHLDVYKRQTVKNPVAKSLKIAASCTNVCEGGTCTVSVTSVNPKLASKAVTYSTSCLLYTSRCV